MRDAGRSLAGVALMAAAMACFASMDATIKVLAAGVPMLMVVWARNLFQLTVVSAGLLPRRGVALFRTRRPGLQVARGALLLGTSVTGFFGIQAMPLAEFTAILLLTPLALTAVAALSRSEVVPPLRWACVAAGLGGAMLVLRPQAQHSAATLWLALAIVAINTAHQWVTSRVARLEDAGTTQFYTGLLGTLLASVGLPLAWQALSAVQWGQLLVVCVFGMSGHQLLIHAYQRAPVSQLSPYLYLQLAFATLAGWLLFGHSPDRWTCMGLLLIAGSGVLASSLKARSAATAPSLGGGGRIEPSS